MGRVDRLDPGGSRLPHGGAGLGLRTGNQLHRLHGQGRQRVPGGHRRTVTPLRAFHLRSHGMAGRAPGLARVARTEAADRPGGRDPDRGTPRHDHLRRPRRRRGHRRGPLPAAEPGRPGRRRPCPPGPPPRLSGERAGTRPSPGAAQPRAAAAERARRPRLVRAPAAGQGAALPAGRRGRPQPPGHRDRPAPGRARLRARPRTRLAQPADPRRPHHAQGRRGTRPRSDGRHRRPHRVRQPARMRPGPQLPHRPAIPARPLPSA